MGYRAGVVPELRWPLHDGGFVTVSGTFATNQMGLRVEAAKRDLGIAIVVKRLVATDLASGALVRILPKLVGRWERVSLVYVDREFLDPKIRAFLDFFAANVTPAT